eukprot:5485511-Lingulodinium_polyedra.AAC.1
MGDRCAWGGGRTTGRGHRPWPAAAPASIGHARGRLGLRATGATGQGGARAVDSCRRGWLHSQRGG